MPFARRASAGRLVVKSWALFWALFRCQVSPNTPKRDDLIQAI
jgi:hypothetical protein